MAERVLLYGPNGAVLFSSARLAADDLALPTAPDVLAVLMGYDGTNLDLLRKQLGSLSPVTVANAGALRVSPQLMNGAGDLVPIRVADSDGIDNQNLLNTVPLTANNAGTVFDRLRANQDVTVLASAARTATTSSADQTNYSARGILLHFDISAVPTVDTVTLTITAKSPIDGVYETLLTGSAEVAVAKRAYLVYPGAGVAANGIDVVNGFPLPRIWRVTVTHSAAGSFTYSVGAQYIV